MKAEYDVEVEWLPFELHPGIPPEGGDLPEYVRRSKSIYETRLTAMAAEAGMPMVFHDRMISSRRALEASEYAREKGCHMAFHTIVFRKFYGEGQDIHDWQVLRAAAVEAGLDPDEMERRTEAGDFKAVVDRSTMESQMRGIRGVPAYVFESKYLISGAQPYEVFRQVMEELEAEPR